LKKSMQAVALLGVAALALSACGSKSNGTSASSAPPVSSATTSTATSSSTAPVTSSSAPVSSAPTSSAPAAGALTACMVLDTGGVDDHSFNQSSWAGLQAASAANPNIKISYVPSNSQNDYAPNLANEKAKGCGTIIAVGGLMAGAVATAAKKNPTQTYAEIDNASQGANIYGLQYNTAQGAFLGGYLAAGMTKTGVVATYGGLDIPPVTIYMDGFWEGVQYYNSVKKTNVKVLGWDETKQKAGTFSNGFSDQNKGKQITQAFEGQKADIVFPVAGGVGLGSAAAAKQSGGKLSVIWVDTDGCISVPADCSVFLTSVTKGLTSSVTAYANALAGGAKLGGTNFVGTLSNDGTGIAPFHDFDSKVPAALKTELDQVKADIISGKIKITSPSQPK
jgi:basic membrane protein A and related proteins